MVKESKKGSTNKRNGKKKEKGKAQVTRKLSFRQAG